MTCCSGKDVRWPLPTPVATAIAVLLRWEEEEGGQAADKETYKPASRIDHIHMEF